MEQVDTASHPSPKVPAWTGLRAFRVERKVFEDEARQVCSFYLVPVDGGCVPVYRPGQYLTFKLEVPAPETGEPKSITRCYSLSDRYNPNYYRITVKRIPAPTGDPAAPPGCASSYLHDQVEEGDLLLAEAPGGHFYLTDDTQASIVLVAGGIGITPLLSMLYSSLQNTPRREVWFFYGVRNRAEQIMGRQLQQLARDHGNLHLLVCYSRPDVDDVVGGDYQYEGRVDIDRLRQTLPPKHFHFYVCGPRSMMEGLVPALADWGVAHDRIHYESFGPASLPVQQEAASAMPVEMLGDIKVTFSESGKCILWDPEARSLLAFAEANDIAADFGCRAGACGTCQTSIESGEVTYNQEPEAVIKQGHCLLCISKPKSDLKLKL